MPKRAGAKPIILRVVLLTLAFRYLMSSFFLHFQNIRLMPLPEDTVSRYVFAFKKDLEGESGDRGIFIACPGGSSEPTITVSANEVALLNGYKVILALPSWGGLNFKLYEQRLSDILDLLEPRVKKILIFSHSMGAHRAVKVLGRLGLEGVKLIISGMTFEDNGYYPLVTPLSI